jgi:hypothetical protein
MMKRILVFVALFVALNVFGAVAMVSAHRPVIIGTTFCADSDGDFLVYWEVSADVVRGLTWTINGETLPDSESFYFVSPYTLADGLPQFTVTASWSNGEVSTLSGVVPVPESCLLPSAGATGASQALPETGQGRYTVFVWLAYAVLAIGMVLIGIDRGPRPRF